MAFLCQELEKEKLQWVRKHVKECSSCREELFCLQEVLEGAERLKPEIQKSMDSVDWDSLSSKITASVFKEPSSSVSSWSKVWKFIFQPKLRPVYAGVLLGIILGSVVTFLILSTSQLQAPGEKIMVPTEFLEKVELELARRETLNYLRQSEYVLLDLLDDSPPKVRGERLFVQEAEELLSKKKYIDQQLNKMQMAKAKKICDQIELLFYELIQTRDQLSEEEMEKINGYIRQKQLLLKINLVKKELTKSEV